MSFEQRQTQEHDQPQRDGAMALGRDAAVGPRPLTFQQVREANAKDAPAEKKAEVAQQPEAVFALQKEARKGAKAKWQAKREEFERKVAIRATKNPKVQDAVDQMCQKAVSFVLKMHGDKKSQMEAVEKLGFSKFNKGEDPDFAAVVQQLKSGSIREKMTLLGTFHETIGKQMLEEGGPEKMKKQMEQAAEEQKANANDPEKAGLKVEDLTAERKDADGKPAAAAEFTGDDFERYSKRATEYKKDVAENTKPGEKANLDPRAMLAPTKAEGETKHAAYAKAKAEDHDTKLPALSVAKLQAMPNKDPALAPAKDQGGGMTAGAEGSSLVKSTKKLSEHASQPGLSEEENKYRLDLSAGEMAKVKKQGEAEGEETLPWIEGQKANILKADEEFIKDAKEQSMPLKSGISGTTMRFMQGAELLGVDPDASRMACMAMLQPIEAHSFHEIATAASGFGGKGGDYAKDTGGEGEGGDKKEAPKAPGPDGEPYSEKSMAPLSREELAEVAADCGTTLEYLNSPPDFDPDDAPPPPADGGPGSAATPPPAAPGTPEEPNA
jgi:hypothetical protein